VEHAQLPAHLLNSHWLAFVGKAGVASDDEQIVEAREVRYYVLGDSVADVVLRRVATQVGEGQYGNGGLRIWRRQHTRGCGLGPRRCNSKNADRPLYILHILSA